MKKNIFSIVICSVCATLSFTEGTVIFTQAEIGLEFKAAIVLLLLGVTLSGLVMVNISQLCYKIRLAEIDARIEQIKKQQKRQAEIWSE